MKKNNHTEEQKQTRRDNKTKIAHRNKKTLVGYLGGKCCLCGYNKCLNSLDFHHVKEKNLSIGRNICRNIEDLMKECDLCVLLCKNCHYEVHEDEKISEEKLIKEMELHKERKEEVNQIKIIQTEIRKLELELVKREKELGFKIKKPRQKTGKARGPMSEEQKAAISETMKARWAKKKNPVSREN